MKKDILQELGYDDLYDRAIDSFDDAISGIVLDGYDYGIAYDESKIPADAIEQIADEDYAVEFLSEEETLEQMEGCLIFGYGGENDYKGAIVGITKGHILYDYDLIAEAKVRDFKPNEYMDSFTYEDAIDDIEFNIIRAMPYYPEGPRVIMDRDAFKDE